MNNSVAQMVEGRLVQVPAGTVNTYEKLGPKRWL